MANSEVYTALVETSAFFTSGVLVFVILFAMLKVWQGSKAAFLIYLLGLLLLSNITYIIYMSLYNLRHRLEQCAFQQPTNCYSQL